MIKTLVNLSDGRKNVEAYYLDEQDRKNFLEMWSRTSTLKLKVERFQNDVELLLQSVDAAHVKPFVKKRLREYIQYGMNPNKSYRMFEFTKDFPYRRFAYELFYELVEDGVLIHRGSGWYRLNPAVLER